MSLYAAICAKADAACAWVSTGMICTGLTGGSGFAGVIGAGAGVGVKTGGVGNVGPGGAAGRFGARMSWALADPDRARTATRTRVNRWRGMVRVRLVRCPGPDVQHSKDEAPRSH